MPETLAKLKPEELNAFVEAFNAWKAEQPVEVEGDGKGEFLPPMTESEYATWVHENEQGWKKVYDRFLGRK